MVDQRLLQSFIINACSGVSKSQLKRNYLEDTDLSETELDELIKEADFNSKPKFINYNKLSKLYIPDTAFKYPYPFTQIYTQENFLTKKECKTIIESAESDLQRSSVASVDDSNRISDVRTSSSASLSYTKSDLYKEVNFRISYYLGLDPFLGEDLQLQKYNPGEYYREHHDYFSRFSKVYKTYTEWMGQRTWTFMIYLNTVSQGGETYFKHLNLKIKPKRGMAVFWNNLWPFGWENYKTMHEALPPVSNNKYIITKWYRSWPLL